MSTILKVTEDVTTIKVGPKLPSWAFAFNVETLTANKTLTNQDAEYQALTPSGANRDVILPAGLNHPFLITNPSGSGYSLVVKSGLTTIATLAAGESARLVSDGAAWHDMSADGTVVSVVAGTGIKVDSSDAANPEVSTKTVVNFLVQSGAISTGDGKVYIGPMPSSVNGKILVSAIASVLTKSTSGTPTVQLARGRQADAASAHTFSDMLSTAITIDANEYSSLDATTPPVINTTNDDLATGDFIRVDVDVAGTGTADLYISLVFEAP